MKWKIHPILIGVALLFCFRADAQAFQHLKKGALAVEYVAGDEEAAQRTLRLVEEALAEFAPLLPPGTLPITTIIAPDADTFHRFARNYLPGQIAGLAQPEHGIIVLRGARLRNPSDNYGALIRHELVHILLHRNTSEPALPRWLNEGVAMLLAREYQFASPITIGRMFLENRMIAYKDLDWAFLNPGQETAFNDAYAQSLSMTRFLYKKLGKYRFWKIILATKNTPFPDALEEYGDITVAGFMNEYLHSLWLVALIGVLASGSLFAPLALLSIIAYIRIQRRNQHTLDQWAMEEADATERPVVISWEEVLDDETTYIPGIDDEED